MEKPFQTGFFFGLGFAVATGVIGGIAGLLAANIIASQWQISLQAPSTHPTASTPQRQARTVYVPPKEKPECLAETGGEINAQFLRCREGYSYTVSE